MPISLRSRDGGPGSEVGLTSTSARLGVGMYPARYEIRLKGRVSGLGGSVVLETAPNAGTEWEVRVPR